MCQLVREEVPPVQRHQQSIHIKLSTQRKSRKLLKIRQQSFNKYKKLGPKTTTFFQETFGNYFIYIHLVCQLKVTFLLAMKLFFHTTKLWEKKFAFISFFLFFFPDKIKSGGIPEQIRAYYHTDPKHCVNGSPYIYIYSYWYRTMYQNYGLWFARWIE